MPEGDVDVLDDDIPMMIHGDLVIKADRAKEAVKTPGERLGELIKKKFAQFPEGSEFIKTEEKDGKTFESVTLSSSQESLFSGENQGRKITSEIISRSKDESSAGWKYTKKVSEVPFNSPLQKFEDKEILTEERLEMVDGKLKYVKTISENGVPGPEEIIEYDDSLDKEKKARVEEFLRDAVKSIESSISAVEKKQAAA